MKTRGSQNDDSQVTVVKNPFKTSGTTTKSVRSRISLSTRMVYGGVDLRQSLCLGSVTIRIKTHITRQHPTRKWCGLTADKDVLVRLQQKNSQKTKV